jgi:hypothetical protein
MGVEPTDGAAGDPSLFALFGDDLCTQRIDLFPLLGTDHNMEFQSVSVIGAKIVRYRIDPLEMLLSLTPVLSVLVVLLVAEQAVVFLPNAG